MRKFLIFTMMLAGLLMSPVVQAQSAANAELVHQLLSYELQAGEDRVIEAPFDFQAIALDEVHGVQLRYLQDGVWTDWETLDHEEEEHSGSELLFVKASSSFALRSSSDLVVQVTLMHFEDPVYQVASVEGLPQTLAANTSDSFHIQSRAEWGADESLRTYDPSTIEDDGDEVTSAPVNACEPIESAYPGQYQLKDQVSYFDDSGRNLIWPLRYSKQVKKVVIHHTAKTMRDLNEDGIINSRDYRLAVQAIYTYHTVTNGWGDIGYHYLVDPDGNVYEGRAGGKDVIGAHVLCQNSNMVGIAVMGNFVEERLTRQAFEGLVNATHHATETYNINPLGQSSFRGTVLPHIVTHAEVGAVTKSFIGRGATQCPGTFLIDDMPRLRQMVANGGVRPSVGYELIEKPRRISLDPLESYSVPLVLKNTGEQMWTSISLQSNRTAGIEYENTNILVASGQSFDILLPLEASYDSGKTSLGLQVILNGQRMKTDIPLIYTVSRPQHRYELVKNDKGPKSLLLGEKREVSMTLKNTSNFPWLHEGRYQVQIREVRQDTDEVRIPSRALSLFLSEEVPIGAEVTLSFDIPAQKTEGDYRIQLAPVLGTTTGFRGRSIVYEYAVEKPSFVADFGPVDKRKRLQPGFTEEVLFDLKNTGNFDWDANSVWIAIDGSGSTAKQYVSQALGVGQSVSIPLSVRAGYQDREVLVKGTLGLDRLPDSLSAFRLKSNKVTFEQKLRSRGKAQLSAEYVGQALEIIPNTAGVSEVWVDLKNTGNAPWYRQGDDRIVLEVQNQADFMHRSWENKRSEAGFLEKEMVMPGEVGRFLMTLQVKRTLRRSTYDDFSLLVNGKTIRIRKGMVRFGVEGKLPERREKEDLREIEQIEESTEESSSFQFSVSNEISSSNSQASRIEPPDSQLPPMRVLLTEIDQDDVRVTASGSFRTWVSSTEKTKEYSAGDEVKVLASHVEDGTVIRMRALGEDHFQFTNWDRIRTFGAGINDNTFRGVLEFRWDAEEGRLIVINELPLDQYMKGVAEVPETTDQPQEKRKVIAVLARSYALHYLISGYEKFPGKPYNAADSPAIFQKYVGANFESRSPKWQAALESTRDEVILLERANGEGPRSKGDIVRAAYFSCTDGERTKSWDEVWPDNEYFQRYGEVFQSVSDPLGDDPGREGNTACGHQVGLSGYGATQKAAQGATYDEIIQDYYQGVEVGVFE